MGAGFGVHSLIGFFLLHAIAWALSENRRTVAWRPVIAGMLLTLGLVVLLLKVPLFTEIFFLLNDALNALEKATREGTSFVFGFLGGGPLPFSETYPGAAARARRERAVRAALLLAGASLDREGVFASPAKDHGRRRRDRLVLRGERVRRHGRGTADRQALYPEHEPQ